MFIFSRESIHYYLIDVNRKFSHVPYKFFGRLIPISGVILNCTQARAQTKQIVLQRLPTLGGCHLVLVADPGFPEGMCGANLLFGQFPPKTARN